jgi:nucleoside-diphosphate-sugar epimerase
MKVLVTGATGFLGQHICRALLQRGHELAGLSRHGGVAGPELGSRYRSISYAMGDQFPEAVLDFTPEVIVHLAWDGIPDFSEQKCVANVESQLRFLNETKRFTSLRKILVAGTCREYGLKQGVCIESDSAVPDSYFSWAKQSLHDFFSLNCQKRGISLSWFRIFYVFGPGQRGESLIPTLISAFKKNTEPKISNPMAVNDYIYISDVVKAFVMSAENVECEGTFNLGSGRTTSIAEIVKRVEYSIKGMDKSSSDIGGSSWVENRNNAGMWADLSLSNKLLRWAPEISLQDGIKLTCRLATYE